MNRTAKRSGQWVLGLLIVAVLVGCDDGGGAGVATAGGAPGASADDAERIRRYGACMRDHGIDMVDPQPGDTGLPRPVEKPAGGTDAFNKLNDAQAAGRGHIPNGGEAERPPAEFIEQQRQWAMCMRDNGVPDFPDPDPGTGAFDDNSKQDGPGFRSALEKCRSTRPGGESSGPATR